MLNVKIRVIGYRHARNYRTKTKGKSRNTLNECVKVGIKMLRLVKDDARDRDKGRSLTSENRPTLPQCDNYGGVILYGLRSCDVKP